ncbi:glycerol-3-phosphate acyltransferase [Candidatus Parcubacteria bacterium]|nr:glycerol-3-phosphate acyltransferase [Candidatus Parcubacteria bacterium]
MEICLCKKEFLFLWLSYFLGSICFGFFLAKIFAKKDVFKVGWKKASASNVYFNVDKKIGILAGILDLLKGSFVVWTAKKLDFQPVWQIIFALFTILGHNWSVFLNFAGGRGVGTFLGAMLILEPKILALSILPTLILVFLLNSPLATLFLFVLLAGISIFLQNYIVFSFSLLSFILIVIKRLSPIQEIFSLKSEIIKNRLLYDRDEYLPTKIEQWIQKKFKN